MLQGNTANLPLQNIFQTLALNQQEGILTINFQRQERHIGIRRSCIFILCERPNTSRVLQQVLAIRGILSESEYENVFATAGAPAPPGDLLLSRHILQRNQLDEVLREQLLEFTYEIFEWRNANYRFEVKQIPDDRMLFSNAEIARVFTFPANAILMEAVRREDEWGRIRQVIPNQHQIFKLTPGAKIPESLATPVNHAPARLQKLLKLIDGERTVEEIIADSKTPSFFVCSIVHGLIAAKVVEAISLEEKRALSEVLRKRYQLDKVANVYRSILEEDSDDDDTRRKLVIFLERKKALPQELLPHYHRIVDATRQKGDLAATQQYVQKILELNPKDVGANEQRVLLHVNDKKNKNWNQAIKEYSSAVRGSREFERGARFLLQIAESREVEGAVIHEAAHLFLLAGNLPEASTTYERAAKVFTSEGDRQSLLKVIEKLEICNASAAARWRKQLESPRRGKKRRRARLTLLGVMAFVLATLGYGAYEWDARVTYAEVLESANVAARFGNSEEARRQLLEFKKRHNFSIIAQSVSSAIAAIEKVAAEAKGAGAPAPTVPAILPHVFVDVERLVTEGSALKRKGELVRALALYQSVDLRTLPPNIAENVRQEITAISAYLREAASLHEKGKAAEAAKDYEEAHRLYSLCFAKYPHSPAAKNLRLPHVLEVEPPTAFVTVNGAPLTGPANVFWLGPTEEAVVCVSAPSFVPWKKPISAEGSAKTLVQLQKQSSWIQTIPAYAETESCAFGGRAFIGTRGGTVLALDERTGEQLWEFHLEGLGDCLGAIRRVQNDIVFAGTDGAVYRVASESGEQRYRVALPAKFGFARVPFTAPDASGRICLATTAGHLLLLNLEKQSVVWEHHTGGSGDLAPAQCGARIFAADRGGRLAAYDVETGNRVWLREFREAICTGAACVGDLVVIGFESGRIGALQASDGTDAWIGLPGSAACGNLLPLAADSFAVLTADGSLSCKRAIDGSDIWEVRTRAAFTHGPRALGELLCVVDDAGQLVAYRAADGRRAWNYATGDAPSTAPLAAGDFVLVLGKNRRVHAVSAGP